jgi:hypothetical protein
MRALLAIAILLPVSVLFVHGWRVDSDVATSTKQEQHGVAYLRVLQPVLTALTADESLAVSREAVPFEALQHAMTAAGTLDSAFGDELQTHDRWQGLQRAVDGLQRLNSPNPVAAFSSYSAATALLLALCEKVRGQSGLARDQDADTFYLEDGAARALPAGVVAVGQYSDLILVELYVVDLSTSANTKAAKNASPANVAAADTASANVVSAQSQVVGARTALVADSGDVGDDAQLAVDATASQTLSAALLAKLDRFRRSIDALSPAGANSVPSGEAIATSMKAKAETQLAGTDLSTALLTAIDGLLTTRLSDEQKQQELTLAALIVVVLVALTPLAMSWWSRRRTSAATRPPSGGATPAISNHREFPAQHGFSALNERDRSGASR